MDRYMSWILDRILDRIQDRVRDRIPILLMVICAAAALSGCGRREEAGERGSPESQSSTGGSYTIAVIPKGTTHMFWNSVEKGAKDAGEELEVSIIWKGPLKENDRAQQIQVMQQFIAQGVDGIVLAPLDFRALVSPVRDAMKRDIPVVIFDSALEGEPGEDFVSFVATNNLNGGRLGGERLAEILGNEGKVVLLRYLVGSASTNTREEGFLEAIRQRPAMEVLVDNRYAGPTAGEAKTRALNMIDQIRRADGIFCSNESATYGMLLALRQEGLAGEVRFVGFDASPPLVQALTDGEIDALVVQDPEKMGFMAVGALVRYLNGEEVEPVVDTGAVLVTRDNMDDPEIVRLIGRQ